MNYYKTTCKQITYVLQSRQLKRNYVNRFTQVNPRRRRPSGVSFFGISLGRTRFSPTIKQLISYKQKTVGKQCFAFCKLSSRIGSGGSPCLSVNFQFDKLIPTVRLSFRMLQKILFCRTLRRATYMKLLKGQCLPNRTRCCSHP